MLPGRWLSLNSVHAICLNKLRRMTLRLPNTARRSAAHGPTSALASLASETNFYSWLARLNPYMLMWL